MNLIGQKVFHKAFNKTGIVVNQFTKCGYEFVEVQFDDGKKPFSYPSAFIENLKCENANLQAEIIAEVSAKTEAAKILAQQERERVQHFTPKIKRQAVKLDEKANIAFKCNFCNGGKNKNGIGFVCACSDSIIKNNIEIAKREWCSNQESPCYLYYSGKITRGELDAYAKQDNPVCYESQMLSHWTARAGYKLSKDRKLKPNKLNGAKINSLAILTTREPNDTEDNRIIFGVFLVDDYFSGDSQIEGYVRCNSKYKIGLSLTEARKMLFWEYYQNANAIEKKLWGSGLQRYLSDNVAARILNDIAIIKRGTTEEELAQEFYSYYCITHGIEQNKNFEHQR